MINPKYGWVIVTVMSMALALGMTGCGYKAPPFYEEKAAR